MEHSRVFGGKHSVSQGECCLSHQKCCALLLFSLFSLNLLIIWSKLVQRRCNQTGCHNTTMKRKTKFQFQRTSVCAGNEGTSKTGCFLFSALCCTSLSLALYKPGLACKKQKNKNKKPLLAGAGRKKGGEIREGRPGPGFVS